MPKAARVPPPESPAHEEAERLIAQIANFHQARGQDIRQAWRFNMRTQVLPRFTRSPLLTAREQYRLVRRLTLTLERVKRGESVEKYRQQKDDSHPYNPEFHWQNYVGRGTGIIPSVRKPPVEKKFILPEETYQMAFDFEELERDTLELTITAISDWFEARGEAFKLPAEEWKEKTLDRLKDVHRSKSEAGFNEEYALLELIVVAERLRNWECLPDPKGLFIGEIKEIENKIPDFITTRSSPCEPSRSHYSLGRRISLRTAARIGYVGRPHPDGGMTFSTIQT